jgi:multidrug transporter EmrE-like cation transporter
MAWVYLAIAIVVEVAATVSLRASDGFTEPLPAAAAVVGYALSIWLLALSLKGLEVSLVYAVWAGIGTAAIAVIGMAALGESVNAVKIASIGLVIAGVVGLNVAGAH